MKQHHLSTKFLMFYIFIGVFGFFLVTLGGSYMVEKHFEHSLSTALYTEAHNIASNDMVKNNMSSSTVDSLTENLSAIAVVLFKATVAASTRTEPPTPVRDSGNITARARINARTCFLNLFFFPSKT